MIPVLFYNNGINKAIVDSELRSWLLYRMLQATNRW